MITTASMLPTFKGCACSHLTQSSLHVLKEHPLFPLMGAQVHNSYSAQLASCDALAFHQLLLKLQEVGSDHAQAQATAILSALSTF